MKTTTQTCDRCGTAPDTDMGHSFSDIYLCDGCANRVLDTLRSVAQWWAAGGASLSPDAVLGDDDKTIRQMVEDATGIRRE